MEFVKKFQGYRYLEPQNIKLEMLFHWEMFQQNNFFTEWKCDKILWEWNFASRYNFVPELM